MSEVTGETGKMDAMATVAAPGVSALADDAPVRPTETVTVAERLKENAVWLWLLIPFVFASWIPVMWAWDWWGNPRSPVFLQPLVPLLSAALVWSRRAEIGAAYRRATDGARRSFWVRGNYLPLILGCLGLLFAHIVHVKGIAIFSLWLIAVGAVYALYGLLVLKAAWVPLLFSLLIIPPPDGLMVSLGNRSLHGVSAVSATLLRLFTHASVDQHGLLRLDDWGYTVEFRDSMEPTSVLLPALTLGLWYVLYRRLHLKQAAPFLIAIAGIALVLSLGEAVAVAVAYGQKRELGDLLQFYLPISPAYFVTPDGFVRTLTMLAISWGRLFVSFVGALLITRQRLTNQLARPTGMVANRLGQGVGLIFYPLVALLNGIGKMGKVFGSMERGTEKMLSRMSRKKKNRGW